MHQVSERFLTAVRRSHRVVAYVDVSNSGEDTLTVPIIGGSVSIDRTSDVRRSANAQLATRDMATHQVARLKRINPYSTRVQIWRGIKFGDDVEELVPLGLFWVESVEWGVDDTVLSLRLADQAIVVKASTMPFARTIDSGSTLSVISALLGEVYASAWNALTPTDNLIVDPAVTDAPLAAVEVNDNRWSAVEEMARSLGAEIWADHSSSNWRITPTPDPHGDPVWRIDTGPDGVLTDYKRALSRDGVRNFIVARQENQNLPQGTQPIYAIAQDTRADSPTAISRFGRVTDIYESPTLNTKAKAQAAADMILALATGLASTLDLSTVPNPALDASDVIEVAFPTGLTETHVIDSLSIPLSHDGDFAIGTRANTVRL